MPRHYPSLEYDEFIVVEIAYNNMMIVINIMKMSKLTMEKVLSINNLILLRLIFIYDLVDGS